MQSKEHQQIKRTIWIICICWAKKINSICQPYTSNQLTNSKWVIDFFLPEFSSSLLSQIFSIDKRFILNFRVCLFVFPRIELLILLLISPSFFFLIINNLEGLQWNALNVAVYTHRMTISWLFIICFTWPKGISAS